MAAMKTISITTSQNFPFPKIRKAVINLCEEKNINLEDITIDYDYKASTYEFNSKDSDLISELTSFCKTNNLEHKISGVESECCPQNLIKWKFVMSNMTQQSQT